MEPSEKVRAESLETLAAAGIPEYIEVMDYIMDRLNKADDLVEESMERLFEEIKEADSEIKLGFLHAGIRTVRSMGEAILETIALIEEVHMRTFQDFMMRNPEELIKVLVDRLDIDEHLAESITEKVVSTTPSSDPEEVLEIINELEGLVEIAEEKSKEKAPKTDSPWDFSDFN